MAYQVEVEQTFYFVKTSELNNIPIVEGNFIALSDGDGIFYDVGNPAGSGTNVTRREVSGRIIFVTSLPELGDSNNTYILDTGRKLIGTNQTEYEVYCWNNSAWQKVATNTQDINVNSVVSNNTKAYITGSATATSNTGTLIKREDVFISADGIISAKGFTGGTIDAAKEANHAVSADNADIAEKDTSNNMINEYYRDVNVSGRDLVFTRGNGTTKSITTPFTDVVSVNSNGLAPQMPNDATKNILSRNANNAAEWVALDVSNLPARSATYDSNNQNIAGTYVAGMSFDNNTRKLTYTNGGGADIGFVSIPDTSYEDYSGPGNGHGLVPASTSGSAQRYFRVDGTWSIIPDFTGATSSANGAAGLVKAPQSADIDKFLKGDGSWSSPVNFSGSSAGLVPTSTSATQDKFLRGDGNWSSVPEYVGATASSDGVAGLVNPATSADRNKFYRGDGIWSEYPTFSGSDAGLVPVSDASSQSKFLQGNGTWGDIQVFGLNSDGVVPGPSMVDVDSYLNASGSWSTPIRNTAGTTDVSDASTYTLSDTFNGDGIATAFTLRYTPNVNTLTVTVDGVPATGADFTLTDNVITFNVAPSDGASIVTYYDVSSSAVKLLIAGGLTQESYSQTYTTSSLYVLNNKLYSNNKEVATVDAIPTVPGIFGVSVNGLVPGPTTADATKYLASDGSWTSPLHTPVTDTSFTAIANLDVVAKKYGNSYYITLDGTADSAITAGYDIVTTSAPLSFNKTYAMGLVGATPALFTLNGTSIICNTAISANDIIAVSFNALA